MASFILSEPLGLAGWIQRRLGPGPTQFCGPGLGRQLVSSTEWRVGDCRSPGCPILGLWLVG